MRKEFANSMRATHIRSAGAHEAEGFNRRLPISRSIKERKSANRS